MQALVNHALRHLKDRVCIVYLDNIIIFSKTDDQHARDVKAVLNALIKNNLCVKAEKSKFHTQSITFLGQVVSPAGMSMCPSCTSALLDYPVPSTIKELKSFLGMTNSYCRYVPDFADIALPLHALTTKAAWAKPFCLTLSAADTIANFKRAFATAPVLQHFDPLLPTTLETDASGFAISGLLTQQHGDGPHPVAFWLRKLTPLQRNYGTPDQERLAIVEAVRSWRPYLGSCEQAVHNFQQPPVPAVFPDLAAANTPPHPLVTRHQCPQVLHTVQASQGKLQGQFLF
jgi:hypothetical protein